MKNKVLLAAGSVALVGTIAVGGTLAYLSSITETKKNVFTSSKSIHGKLTETEWNEESASSYYPGKVIAKNPQIVMSCILNSQIQSLPNTMEICKRRNECEFKDSCPREN